MGMSVTTPDEVTVPRPPYWEPGQWAELITLASPDRLCHAMWMVLDDPERVLGDHHHDKVPAWHQMISGTWPSGWDYRVRSAIHVAWARRAARRHPDRAGSILRGVPEYPAHWTAEDWGRLEADIDTSLCFDGLWLLVNPRAALADLRGRVESVTSSTDLNTGPCWLSGTARRTGELDKIYDEIVEFAESRGQAGITRRHIPLAIGAGPASVGKETANGYLRDLVRAGRLVRVRGGAGGRGGGDLYVARSK